MKAGVLILVLLGLCLILPGCKKKTSVPTPREYFKQAEKTFEAGDYAKAAEAYEAYLRGEGTKKEQDKVLFRLGLAYSLPTSPVHDAPQAIKALQQLVSLFPRSPYTPQGKVILNLQEEMQKLNNHIVEREERLKVQDGDLGQLRKEVEKLRADVREREARLRVLNHELEQLKKIDMERRPSRPPR
jgi:outer membrane protein assembly factor BamD (BamD/ComL family)